MHGFLSGLINIKQSGTDSKLEQVDHKNKENRK